MEKMAQDSTKPLVPRMSIDTLITAIEMDLGVSKDNHIQPNSSILHHDKVSSIVPNGHPVADDQTTYDNDECSSCSGSTYSCSESCSSSSESGSEHPETPKPPLQSHITPQNSDPNSGNFQCQYCSRSFLWADAYKTHLSTHRGEKPHVCTICDRLFKNAASLASHVKLHSSSGDFACHDCDFRSSSPSDLTEHRTNTHSAGVETVKIDSGNLRSRPKRTRKPTEKARGDIETPAPPVKVNKRTKRKVAKPTEAKLGCQFCIRKFDNSDDLQRHLLSHTEDRPHECDKCDAKFRTSSQLTQHHIVHSENKPYTCDYCGTNFKTVNRLKSHLVSHSNDRPFSCSVCSATFPRKHTLTKHMRSHTKEKPFKCDECGLSFAHSDRMKEHIKSHKPELQFTLECETCGKKFTHKRNLKVHERIHIGVRKYKCELCPKAFLQASGRSRHMKCHLGDKSHLCETCGLRFAYPSEVVDHVNKIHKGVKKHKCDTCGKFFHSQRDLNRHTRTHTGEKPFSCTVCGRSFSQAYTLKMHLRLHSGDKPLKPKKKKSKAQEEAVPTPQELPNPPIHKKPEVYSQYPVHHDYAQPSESPYTYDYIQQNAAEYQNDSMNNSSLMTDGISKVYVDLGQYEVPYEDYSNTRYETDYSVRDYRPLPPVSTIHFDDKGVNTRYNDDMLPMSVSGFKEGKLPPVSELSRLPILRPDKQSGVQHNLSQYDLHQGSYKSHDYNHGHDHDYDNTTAGNSIPQTVQNYDLQNDSVNHNREQIMTDFSESRGYNDEERAEHRNADSQNSMQDEDQLHRCEGCGETFVTSSDLLDHLKAHIDAELAGISQE